MTKTITIGPYHPYLLEPSIVKLQVDDGKVADATVTVGFVNRAVEELMTTKTFRQDVFLAERICGICSNIHTLAFCQAAEEIMEITVPPRATHIRTVFVELERLHSHFLSLALLAHAVQDGVHFARIMKERETLISLLERLSGNRVHYSVNAIGGVRRDLTEELAADLRASLPTLQALSDFTIDALDFKNVNLLKQFVTDQGRLLPRKYTGLPAHYQRTLSQAIKRARQMLLMK